ncbi:MAG: hypothetical protein O7J95_03680 [Planctomycetota bacterium]|nr:hypothetical protein [Planctomycetota bacterium]
MKVGRHLVVGLVTAAVLYRFQPSGVEYGLEPVDAIRFNDGCSSTWLSTNVRGGASP